MTIDPGDYDLRELREAGLGDLPADALGDGRRGGIGAREAFKSTQRETLMMLGDALGEDALETPYLTALPGSYRAELLILEWLEHLVETAGRGEAIEAVSYYADIEWITEDVEASLREYLRGVSAATEETTRLTQDDHTTSLVYIARLTAMQ